MLKAERIIKHAIILLTDLSMLFCIHSLLLCQDSSGTAGSQKTYRMNPFSRIDRNIGLSFTGKRLLYHSAGIISTIIIVESDMDYKVHAFFNKNQGKYSFTDPAPRLGMIVPVTLGSGLYLLGNIFSQGEKIAAGSAVLQASLVSVTYSWLLKAITGRPGPHPDEFSDMRAASHKFRFGFLRGGIFWGWPSGHLIVNTAAMTSLAYFYKKSVLLNILCFSYIGYMFFGVNAHNGGTMHWFSDTVAGTLMGFAIGSTIGKNIREEWDKKQSEERTRRLGVSPFLATGSQGLFINYAF